MCKFGAHRTTPTAKKWDSRGDIFAMAKMGRVSGFWRFLGKYLGTGPKIPYWEPTGENPWISGLEDIPPLIPADILNFAAVRTNSRTRFRRYARRGVRGRQHQSDRQWCRHIGDGRNDSLTIFGHKMHQLVAVSPDMFIGQFFCECHRHNAEMTPALHFAQRLSGRSWDAILSNVFVNYVYNVLPLQYPTMSRQVGL